MTKNDTKHWLTRIEATLSVVKDRLDYLECEIEQTTEEEYEDISRWFTETDITEDLDSIVRWSDRLRRDLKDFAEEAEK